MLVFAGIYKYKSIAILVGGVGIPDGVLADPINWNWKANLKECASGAALRLQAGPGLTGPGLQPEPRRASLSATAHGESGSGTGRDDSN